MGEMHIERALKRGANIFLNRQYKIGQGYVRTCAKTEYLQCVFKLTRRNTGIFDKVFEKIGVVFIANHCRNLVNLIKGGFQQFFCLGNSCFIEIINEIFSDTSFK